MEGYVVVLGCKIRVAIEILEFAKGYKILKCEYMGARDQDGKEVLAFCLVSPQSILAFYIRNIRSPIFSPSSSVFQ